MQPRRSWCSTVAGWVACTLHAPIVGALGRCELLHLWAPFGIPDGQTIPGLMVHRPQATLLSQPNSRSETLKPYVLEAQLVIHTLGSGSGFGA